MLQRRKKAKKEFGIGVEGTESSERRIEVYMNFEEVVQKVMISQEP